MNFEHLKTMKPDELRVIAGKQGLKIHHKAKPETIIKQIMESVLTPQAPAMQHIAEAPQAAVDHNTPEEIEAAIAKIKERQPAFISAYSIEENTWHFSCKGTEECGNMAIPLRVIVMKAGTISRGRLAPRGLTHEFERLNSSPKNAYTDTVLTF